MIRVGRFLRLTPGERRLLAAALVALAAVRVGLRVLPFRLLRALLARAKPCPGLPRSDDATVDRMAWAVSAVKPCVPGAACLAQALALQVLLARDGEAAVLRVGVARDERLGIRAHAWLEHRGRVIIGGSSSRERYLPLGLPEEQLTTAAIPET